MASTTMKAYGNRYLIVPPSVKLNEKLDKVLYDIDCDFREAPERVTSAVRDSADQLRIIRQYLRSYELDDNYPEAMVCEFDDRFKDGFFVWQEAWSALLNRGVIINPPLPATVLMDYFRNGVNKKGQEIGMSPHTRGTAFDLAGIDSLRIVQGLKLKGKIKSFLVERANNAIHVDIYS
jgi:hypothetical protein